MTSPPGVGGVSPSGPRARSWRHGRACRPAPSWPRPRTASGRHGAARRGRPPSPAPRAPGPGRRRTAGAARGRQPGPGASGDRSPGAPRSAAAGPAPLHLRRAPHPGGRCTGGFDGQRRLRKAKPAAAMPGGLICHARGAGCARTSSEATLFLAQNRPDLFSGLMFGRFCSAAAFSRIAILSRADGPPLPGRGPADASRRVIHFHGRPSARSQTSRRSSGSSQHSQPSASSIRSIASGAAAAGRASRAWRSDQPRPQVVESAHPLVRAAARARRPLPRGAWPRPPGPSAARSWPALRRCVSAVLRCEQLVRDLLDRRHARTPQARSARACCRPPSCRSSGRGRSISCERRSDLLLDPGLAQDLLGDLPVQPVLERLAQVVREHRLPAAPACRCRTPPSCRPASAMNCGVVIAFSSTRWCRSQSCQSSGT